MSKDQKQKFLPDDYVFKQGEIGDKAYLLLDGRVAIEVNGKKVAEISEMEIFGEMSLILKKPRTASIKALKPSIVLPIDQKILNDLLSECPSCNFFIGQATCLQIISMRSRNTIS